MYSNFTKSNRAILWSVIHSLTICSVLITMIIFQDFYFFCHATSSSSTTKRVRQREFLRGGDKPVSTPSTESTVVSKSTVDPLAYKNETTWRAPCVMAPIEAHVSTVIFLHAIGDSGNNWAYSLAHFRPANMKVICPISREMPMELDDDGPRVMRSWFNKPRGGNETNADIEDLKKSTSYIHSLIDEEVKLGIKPDDIVVAGFSQGGALALYAGLSYKHTLGGIIAMASWVPGGANFLRSVRPKNWNQPIMLGHGQKDTINRYHNKNDTARALEALSRRSAFKFYPDAANCMPQEGLDDIKNFLKTYKSQ